VRLERVAQIAAGSLCNVSRLDFSVHTGTHIDAPVHFIEGGAGVETTPLDALIGDAYIVDATSVDRDIDERLLTRLDLPRGARRLIFKTRNSDLWDRPGFVPSFIGLTEGAARALLDRGIALVGVDYLSVAPAADPAPTHIAFLSAGVVILEGLDLRGVEPGPCRLLCLPMLIEGADGAPARALLMKE
jgi:arylformamidase